MARYRLLAPHVIGGQVLPTGTEVGDGTEYPFEDIPSNHMEGLDTEGKKEVDAVHQGLYGRPAPTFESPEEQKKRLEEQQAEEKKALPVSRVQAEEQGKDWPLKGRPLEQTPSTSTRPAVTAPMPATPPQEQLPKDQGGATVVVEEKKP